VEQQVKTNDALSVIQELLGGTSTTGLSNWIGNQVRVLKDASFDGAPIDIYVAPYEGADQARLVVRNSAGETVQSITLPLQTDVFQWAGVLDTGDPLPAGEYGLTVESLLDGEVIDAHQASVYEDVREARFEAGEIVLVFSDGTEMPATAVTAVRQSNN